MSNFLAYEKLKKLHELHESARDLCVSVGIPIENFAEADAKWKEVMSEAYKKVQGGIVSPGYTNEAFVGGEVIVPSIKKKT